MLTLKFDEGFPVMISLKRGLQKVGHLGLLGRPWDIVTLRFKVTIVVGTCNSN